MDSLIDLRAKKEMKSPRKEEEEVLDEDDTPGIVKTFQEIGEEHGFISRLVSVLCYSSEVAG
jgi:hypothetical protein